MESPFQTGWVGRTPFQDRPVGGEEVDVGFETSDASFNIAQVFEGTLWRGQNSSCFIS